MIADKIKNARTIKKLTQEQVAEDLNVSRQTISNWENGKSLPDIVSIIRMSELYDLSLDELLKGDATLLNKIESEYEKNNLVANVLMQINIGREESKSGVLEEDIDELILAVEKCNHVKVKGIMVIIPKGDEVSNRYYFNKSKHIYDDLSKKNYKNIQMEILSMGMTSDFKIAIQEGANLIRIGSGIFGER